MYALRSGTWGAHSEPKLHPMWRTIPVSNVVLRRSPTVTSTKGETLRRPLQATQRPYSGNAEEDDPTSQLAPWRHPAESPRIVGDWRAFRARLVSLEAAAEQPMGEFIPPPPGCRWLHQLAGPEQGCLLLARRDDSDLFAHSVIFVLGHYGPNGSTGMILNSPGSSLMGDLSVEAQDVRAAFSTEGVAKGGPVESNQIFTLHARPDVEGSVQVLPGIHTGGLRHASALVRAGRATPGDFRFFMGFMGWAPGDLEREVEAGRWWPVAASVDIIRNMLAGTGACNGTPDMKRAMWLEMLSMLDIDPATRQRKKRWV